MLTVTLSKDQCAAVIARLEFLLSLTPEHEPELETRELHALFMKALVSASPACSPAEAATPFLPFPPR